MFLITLILKCVIRRSEKEKLSKMIKELKIDRKIVWNERFGEVVYFWFWTGITLKMSLNEKLNKIWYQ